MVGSTTQWFGRDVVLLSMRDLTERRRFELASGHEAQFRSLVHNAGSVIMLVSEDGVLQSVSSVITRLLGHDPEQLEGLPLAGIVAPRDRPQFASALAAAWRGATAATPVTVRVGLIRHDRGVVPFELHLVNLLEDPTVEGLVITAHDASSQVSVEHDLGEALSRLTATLDSTADGILVADTAGKITDFNRRFVEIWGLPDHTVARHDDVSTLAVALDQLIDPDEFVARLQEIGQSPESEASDILAFKDGRVIEGFSRPSASGGRSSAGSTASGTSPTARCSRTSSPTAPFTTP